MFGIYFSSIPGNEASTFLFFYPGKNLLQEKTPRGRQTLSPPPFPTSEVISVVRQTNRRERRQEEGGEREEKSTVNF